jgi:dipeptidyl aminopeptidase/acylaminoacyl peptidase
MPARRVLLVMTVVVSACGSSSTAVPSATSSPAAVTSATATIQPTAAPTAIEIAAAVSGRPGDILFEHWGNAPDGTPTDPEEVHLWLVKADGTGLHELAPGQPGPPITGKGVMDWAPDGRHIAFTTEGHGPPYIFETDIDGAAPRLLSTECESKPGSCGEFLPAYSPDGKRLAFLRHVDDPPSGVIGIRDLATGHVTLLESTRETSPKDFLGGARWSPDGTQLVYDVVAVQDEQPVGAATLFVVTADGRARHQLATPGVAAFDPWWSPDGSLIAFSSGVRDDHARFANIYVVHPDGTGLLRLTSDNGSTAPTWTWDGKILYFGQTGADGPWLMDANGANAVRVWPGTEGSATGFSYRAEWQPQP